MFNFRRRRRRRRERERDRVYRARIEKRNDRVLFGSFQTFSYFYHRFTSEKSMRFLLSSTFVYRLFHTFQLYLKQERNDKIGDAKWIDYKFETEKIDSISSVWRQGKKKKKIIKEIDISTTDNVIKSIWFTLFRAHTNETFCWYFFFVWSISFDFVWF